MSDGASSPLLRTRTPGGHARVGFVELFFDLVFVFAVTQLSHYLLHHHDLLGALQTLLLFLAIWWAWVFTAWATNWLDPERLARSAGARDPAALAAQLLTLVEGAIVGALVDRQGGATRHARELTEIAVRSGARVPDG